MSRCQCAGSSTYMHYQALVRTCGEIYGTMFGKTNRLERENQFLRKCSNTRSSTKMLIEIKRRFLLEDKVSDGLQIWKAAPPLGVKGNKALKSVFLTNRLVFQIRSHIVSSIYNKIGAKMFKGDKIR